jgi:DivIVA domain-containing protein
MELTPELLEEQEFPVVLRGYDTDAVDDFLERVGAGVRVLLERLDQAGARLRDLEAEAASGTQAAAAPGPESEVERVSRALVLAQQAADQTVAEAEVEASRIITEAQTDADARRQKADADVEERARTAEAEVQARADALKAVRDRELAELAARENATRAELHRVEEVLGRQRNQLAAVAASAQELLDKVAAPQGGEQPASTPAATAAPADEVPAVDEQPADEAPADEMPADEVADVDEQPAEAMAVPDEPPPTPAEIDGPPTEAIPVIAEEATPEPESGVPANSDTAVASPSPSNGDSFWRTSSEPEAAFPAPTSEIFDQDEELPAAAPRLRAVAPPEDDPFLAALRGDDQAAAMLHDQPVHGDEPTSSLIRRFRRS